MKVSSTAFGNSHHTIRANSFYTNLFKWKDISDFPVLHSKLHMQARINYTLNLNFY